MAVKHIQKPGSSKCMLIFSAFISPVSLENGNGKYFTFYNMLSRYFDEFSFLFVADESNKWFCGGVSGLHGLTWKSTFSSIHDILSSYDEIHVLGASMGGYAALLYSLHYEVSSTVAIAPQVFMKTGWPRYNSRLEHTETPDLRDVLSGICPQSSIVCVAGSCSLFDLYQQFYCWQWSIINQCSIVEGAYHNVAFFWYRRSILDRFLSKVVHGSYAAGMTPYGGLYDSEFNNIFKRSLLSEVFWREVESYYQSCFDKSNPADSYAIISSINNLFSCDAVKLELGLSEYRLGYYDKAEETLAGLPDIVDDKYGPLVICAILNKDAPLVLELVSTAKSVGGVLPLHAFIKKFDFAQVDCSQRDFLALNLNSFGAAGLDLVGCLGEDPGILS